MPHSTSPSHAPSYYLASAQPWAEQPALEGDVVCDVCVVGGGLAGLSAALNLAERGFSVVLLEAVTIGYGASGRNGGEVISGYSCDMDSLRAQLGVDAARALWEMSVEGVEIVAERVARHGIDCDWTRGYCTAATRADHLRELEAWQRTAGEVYGYRQYQLWDRERLGAQLASARYHGALYDSAAGHLHPLNYTRGLARAALDAGVRVFENSRVGRLETGPRPRLATARGTVSASEVVLACNSDLGELMPALSRRIMPAGTYMVATAPLGAERARSLIANNMAVSDTRFVLDYYRLSADHRLLFGGKVSYSGHEPRDLAASMRRDMLRVFPQLADVGIDYAWGGFCDITMTRAPDFGRAADHVYYLQGFSGHGVNVTGVAGKVVAEAIAAETSRFDVFGRLRHRDFPGGRRLRAPVLALGMLYYRLRDLL